MILCRFADQTAVQLPEERRLMGTTFKKKKDLQICFGMRLLAAKRTELVLMNVAFQTSDLCASCIAMAH